MVNNDFLKRRFLHIQASCFGGDDDENTSAYTGKEIDSDSLSVSLPARVPSYLRKVRVFYRDKTAECVVDDVGPHNTDDDYWNNEEGRPDAENNDGENKAGIDLTPGVWDALGTNQDKGLIYVDWEFILPKKIPKNGD